MKKKLEPQKLFNRKGEGTFRWWFLSSNLYIGMNNREKRTKRKKGKSY